LKNVDEEICIYLKNVCRKDTDVRQAERRGSRRQGEGNLQEKVGEMTIKEDITLLIIIGTKRKKKNPTHTHTLFTFLMRKQRVRRVQGQNQRVCIRWMYGFSLELQRFSP